MLQQSLTPAQARAVKTARAACESRRAAFAVVHTNIMGGAYVVTFGTLMECTEHARFYTSIHDTVTPGLIGFSAKNGAVYVFGYDQLPFRFRAFRIF